MHSFHQSRGRIFFDFFCVLVIVASCMGAWMQTGASALIGAAGAAGLYGLVRLFDMRWSQPSGTIEPQRIEFEPDANNEQPVIHDVIVPFAAAELVPGIEEVVAEAEQVESKASRPRESRPAKSARKSNSRRGGTAKTAEAPQPVPVEDVEPVVPRPAEVTHTHVMPLFEPEPFVRMPRQGFGRRGRI